MSDSEDVPAETGDASLRERMVLLVLGNSRQQLDNADEAERVVAAADVLARFIEGAADTAVIEEPTINTEALAEAMKPARLQWNKKADALLTKLWPTGLGPAKIAKQLVPLMGPVKNAQCWARATKLGLKRPPSTDPRVLAMTAGRAARAA